MSDKTVVVDSAVSTTNKVFFYDRSGNGYYWRENATPTGLVTYSKQVNCLGALTSATETATGGLIADAVRAARTTIGRWDAGNVAVSCNGGSFSSVANASIPALAASSFDVGSSAAAGGYINSEIVWTAVGAGSLADADAASIK